jgi:putative tryptophan/tyrosine transport system substrate-binding protein
LPGKVWQFTIYTQLDVAAQRSDQMKRREFFGVLSGAAFLWSTSAFAQQPRKMHRIGVLWHGANAEQEAIYLAALRQGLLDFGYVEGQNIVLEMRFPAEQYERFFVLAAELAQQNEDVLVCATAIAAVACHHATTTVPIVGVNVADPVGRKLVASLNRPGGNLTGLSNMAVELTGKRIELAKEVIKDLSRVALLVNAADEIGSRAYIAEGDAAGSRLGVAVVPVGVRDANDLEGAISKISTDNFQAMVVTHDGLFYVQRKRLADLAIERRLPTIAFASEQWQAGVLATYGPNVPTLYRRAGAFIDKILKGENPADLPVEQPTKFELLINLRTAKAIGITVPPTILTRADDVIES